MRGPATARSRPGGLLFLGAVLFASGCATPLQSERLLNQSSRYPPIELAAVPFFPQERYQCGPAALATALGWSGVEVSPEVLTPQVYLPAREGSLQPEILGATRRHGRLPYPLPARLEALAAELAAGRPVLVLQNLGLAWYPRWHYAVVVGLDVASDQVVLRSGREARHQVPLAVFERTWRRAGYWGIVVLRPGELPASAEEGPYLKAVAALEAAGRPTHAARAYEAALRRWPQNLAAHIGLGNSRYAAGDLIGAAGAFRQATQTHPDSGIAFNNLAEALAALGRLEEAAAAAARAVELGGAQAATFRDTLEEITRRAAARQ